MIRSFYHSPGACKEVGAAATPEAIMSAALDRRILTRVDTAVMFQRLAALLGGLRAARAL